MAKLIEITGKAISGEWGSDDEDGSGIHVIRTTNFTNTGFIDYSNVITRTITKKIFQTNFFVKVTLLLKNQAEAISNL